MAGPKFRRDSRATSARRGRPGDNRRLEGQGSFHSAGLDQGTLSQLEQLPLPTARTGAGSCREVVNAVPAYTYTTTSLLPYKERERERAMGQKSCLRESLSSKRAGSSG